MRKWLFTKVSYWATDHPKKTILFFSLLTVVAFYFTSLLEIKIYWADVLPENDAASAEFTRIIEEYDAASQIILVVKGDNLKEMKAYANDIEKPLKNVNGVKSVLVKIEEDFIDNHALMLAKTKDLENSKEMFSNLSLIPLLANINDNLEKTYVYSDDEDVLSNKEKIDGAINSLDGIKKFLLTMKEYGEGKYSDNTMAIEAADKFIGGEKYLLSYSQKHLLIMIQPSFSMADQEQSILTVNEIRKVFASMKSKYPNIKAGLAGSIPMGVEEFEAIMGGFWWTIFLAFALIIGLFVFVFRMWIAPVFAGITLIVGLVWAGALARIFVGYLDMMTYMFAIILMGLGIDYFIHFISNYTENRKAGLNTKAAIEMTFQKVANGIATGALTTSVAFFTLMVAATKGMKHFGLICGFGVICCMLASFTILPSLIVLRDKRRERLGLKDKYLKASSFSFLGSLSYYYGKLRWIALSICLLVTGFFFYRTLNIGFDFNMLNLEPKGMPSVVLHDEMIEEFDMSPDYALVTASSIEESRRLANRAKEFPGISDVDSISNFVPNPSEQENRSKIVRDIRSAILTNKKAIEIEKSDANIIISELDRLWMNITEMSSLAFQSGQERLEEKCYQMVANPEKGGFDFIKDFLSAFKENEDKYLAGFSDFQNGYFSFLYEKMLKMANPATISLEDLPASIKSRYVSKKGDKFLVSIYPKNTVWSIDQLKSFNEQLIAISPRATGTPPMFLRLIDLVKVDGRNACLLALIVVFILLVIDFRSAFKPLLAMIPLFAGALWMTGISEMAGMMLNVVNVMALPLIIGIGIDDGVHLVHRYNIEGPDNKIIFSSTGKAILLTSLTTMIGFGSIIITPHRGMASMGIILVIGVGACFLTSVLILAPIFGILKKYSNKG
ncbi:MAG: MMPL family transporter [Pseudomonadota bacterium]